MFYIKVKNIFKSQPNHEMYLAWQNPGWEDTGYFYSSARSIEEFKDIVRRNHSNEHPFIFKSREKAKQFMDNKFKEIDQCDYIICELKEES